MSEDLTGSSGYNIVGYINHKGKDDTNDMNKKYIPLKYTYLILTNYFDKIFIGNSIEKNKDYTKNNINNNIEAKKERKR